MNVFYEIESANIYANTLRIKDNTLFMSELREDLQNKDDISKLFLLGIDGLYTNRLLKINYPYTIIDENLYFYKLPYFGNLWGYDRNGFNKIQILEKFKDKNNFHYLIINEKKQDIIIFRNIFYYFEIFINGKKVKFDKYYNYYRLKDLPKGKHIIEIKFSLLKMLFG